MKRKRKILQVTGSLRMGGLETVALSYYKYINKDHFDFAYLVFGSEKGYLESEVEKLGGKVLRVPLPKNGIFKFYYNVRKILKEEGPFDVVHSHPLFISGLIMKAAYKEKIPIRIAHSHSARSNLRTTFAKYAYNTIMRYHLKKYSNFYLACSSTAGRYLFGEYFFEKMGQVIVNGVDLDRYSFDINVRKKVRDQLNLEKKLVIGHVGRLSDVKNQIFVLKIFKRIKLKQLESKLLFIGDGPDKNKLIKLTKEYQLQDDVFFLGSRNNVNELLQGMDVLLFPSKFEGLGIVILEAQATGLRCVISDIIPDEINVTPLITRISLNQNPDEWAEEVLNFKYDNFRESPRTKFIEKQYTMDSVIKRIETIYMDN